MTPEDLIQSLPPLGGVLREAWNEAYLVRPFNGKACDNAAALAVTRVAVEHVLRELAKQKPAAWLVTGGKAFVDRAFMAQCVAERSAAERKDGGTVVPLCAAPHPKEPT